jgi:hypothetical protein
MRQKILFMLSALITLTFCAAIIFALQTPGIAVRVVIAVIVAIGSLANAYKRFLMKHKPA